MRHSPRLQNIILTTFLLTLITGGTPGFVTAQAPPPSYPPQELDNLVTRIALYPDPLIAQILAGATYPDQIPDAAKYADEHHYLTGDDLARAITADHLPWDPSVQALIPFPSVLEMMASDMNWTSELGNAFLAQQQDVMDAVQRMRKKARDYGYLRSNGQVVVSGGPYITIMPVNPAFVCVPVYDPLIVFAPPRPGFFIGGAIGFGFGVTLGFAFRPWGWGVSHFSGTAMNCTLATRVGAGIGPIALPTFTPITGSNVGVGLVARRGMSGLREVQLSATRHAWAMRGPRNINILATSAANPVLA